MDYKDFLERKKKTFISSGFDINQDELNINLFDFQKYAVKEGAREQSSRAVFLRTGSYARHGEAIHFTSVSRTQRFQPNHHFRQSVIVVSGNGCEVVRSSLVAVDAVSCRWISCTQGGCGDVNEVSARIVRLEGDSVGVLVNVSDEPVRHCSAGVIDGGVGNSSSGGKFQFVIEFKPADVRPACVSRRSAQHNSDGVGGCRGRYSGHNTNRSRAVTEEPCARNTASHCGFSRQFVGEGLGIRNEVCAGFVFQREVVFDCHVKVFILSNGLSDCRTLTDWVFGVRAVACCLDSCRAVRSHHFVAVFAAFSVSIGNFFNKVPCFRSCGQLVVDGTFRQDFEELAEGEGAEVGGC